VTTRACIIAATVAAGVVACATPRADGEAMSERRAILVSFDALSEARVRELPRTAVPHLHALFDDGACAAYAVAAFPSVTAPGHAAIWTGAYGDVNGVAANLQPRLPRDRHALDDLENAFAAGPLRAEPIWITAALNGVRVVAHHPTQAPQPPGYRPLRGEPDATLRAARERAERALQLPIADVMNGYNRVFTRGIAVTHHGAPTRPATGWKGLEALPTGAVPPREAAWQVLEDSVFAIFYGQDRYTHVRIALERDAGRGVEAMASPADTTALRSRPLARHFSEALELPVENGRAYLRARLFELSDDGREFLLYHPALGVVETNRADVSEAYDAVVRGWAGNGAYLMGPQGFGTPLTDGGDGSAEDRYLETLEFVTRQFIRGAEWGWNERRARLLVDYHPVADEIDHTFYGLLARETPGHDPAVAARIERVRERGWILVDLRMQHLMELVRRDPNSALFVTGDHGMRPYWRVFRPNVALRDAGLLATAPDGSLDLARTRAFAPNGFWIAVNRADRPAGIVTGDDVAATLAAAEIALRSARDENGEPIVTRVWRADQDTLLGLGGPVGGDLYFELARGFYYDWRIEGGLVDDVAPNAGHGFPPTAEDMHTALCAFGTSFPARRSRSAFTIDAAPTVAEWLHMPAPPHARGRSRLAELGGG
jgi:hypothetical protein